MTRSSSSSASGSWSASTRTDPGTVSVFAMLGRRALNRALLARQHLLERESATAIDEIEHLVGMQAQAPLAPYVGLWSRLADFETDELATAVEDHRAVRTSLMRSTIHLVTAGDAFPLRAWTQVALSRGFASS